MKFSDVNEEMVCWCDVLFYLIITNNLHNIPNIPFLTLHLSYPHKTQFLHMHKQMIQQPITCHLRDIVKLIIHIQSHQLESFLNI